MAKRRQDIDDILKKWPFDPETVNVRLLQAPKRQVLQMRVDMGVLQMEINGRPDGNRPHGATTYYDLLQRKAAEQGLDFALGEEECAEVDREFVQFYHRRVCWLQLREFERAVQDADHTLALMDFCKDHSPDEQWTISHEQYRPFVLYHRTQAAALAQLESSRDEAPELAIEEVNQGLRKLRELFVEYQAEEQFDDDELVQRLISFRDNLRDRYGIGRTLQEQLEVAIQNEDYELAAELRDMISFRENMSQIDLECDESSL